MMSTPPRRLRNGSHRLANPLGAARDPSPIDLFEGRMKLSK